MTKWFSSQQVPDDIQSVMSGVQGYFSLRRHVSDSGFSVFKDADDTENALDEKVEVLVTFLLFLMLYVRLSMFW